ncbi:MAG: endo-1,4-beta-xylanase [Oculatellaceae cyanobacterium Prado106]|jgi:endo-1,4-beta-xylanase|nr:endo-1,4-beta-xylanase [Oculatellaceae cyanobacterium Prado106]
MKRRDLLYYGLSSWAACRVQSGLLPTQASRNAIAPISPDTSQVHPALSSQESTRSHPKPTLKQRAAAKNIIYGAECGTLSLAEEPDLAEAIAQECAMLVIGCLKWQYLRPTPYTYDFTYADGLAEFARQQNLQMRGHTLVWHIEQPQWFQEIVNPQNAERVLVEHIQTVMQRYAGRMHSWDVVNEAIQPQDGRSDQLRQSPWLNLLGSDYVDLAFHIAADTDPDTLLVYNDYGVEYDTADHESRRMATLNLLERFKTKGTPVHALGIQSHLVGDQSDFNPERFRRFLGDVASLGFKILITELDVIDQKLPANIQQRDRRVAQVYQEYLDVVLDEPAVIAILQWGLSDRHTWISQFFPRPDGLPSRPLPLDAELKRKPAWSAIAQAFDRSTR